jgi:hypothetical protein
MMLKKKAAIARKHSARSLTVLAIGKARLVLTAASV